jgi:hypothetical protein
MKTSQDSSLLPLQPGKTLQRPATILPEAVQICGSLTTVASSERRADPGACGGSCHLAELRARRLPHLRSALYRADAEALRRAPCAGTMPPSALL